MRCAPAAIVALALASGCGAEPTPPPTSAPAVTSPPAPSPSPSPSSPQRGPPVEEGPSAEEQAAKARLAEELGPKIVAVATKVPEVAAMCREAGAQGATCTLWIERPGARTCPKDRHPTDDCTWEVYVGANMGTHTSRLATIWVDPDKLVPTAASDLACVPMTMAGFRKRVAASKAGKPLDDCPDEIE